MKILHVLDEKWDSGLTAYGLSAASAQAAAGDEVWAAVDPGAFAARAAAERGLPTLPLGAAPGFRVRVGKARFDVVNCHTGRGHFWSWCAVAGRRTALVRTRGDARPVRKRPGQGWLYGRTDAVIAASGVVDAQYRREWPGLVSRLSTVLPGLAVSAAVPEPAGVLRIALVGRLDPVKGHLDFLEMVRRLGAELPHEEFLIAGEEKNTKRGELEKMVVDLGIGDRVRFTGWQDSVTDFMRSCHVGVVASVGSEAVSRACQEWLACGRPVVATSVGCLPELVKPGFNGFLVAPHRPMEMADAVRRLVQDATLRRRLGGQAREDAEERFGLGTFAERTLALYRTAVERRKQLARS